MKLTVVETGICDFLSLRASKPLRSRLRTVGIDVFETIFPLLKTNQLPNLAELEVIKFEVLVEARKRPRSLAFQLFVF
jgi:hypothetical protein